MNQERNRRKEGSAQEETYEEIGSDYWSGGKAEYSYGNLYQAVRNGDSASVETIRKALEASGKDPQERGQRCQIPPSGGFEGGVLGQ